MTRGLLNRRLRQIHLWLGAAIGVQLGLWLVSGLFMTLVPIEQVRGDHLRVPVAPEPLVNLAEVFDPAIGRILQDFDAHSVELTWLDGQLVWLAKGSEKSILVDADSRLVLSPLKEPIARRLADAAYRGRGHIERAALHKNPPREYGRAGPVWRVDFSPPDAASFYVDATTGEVRAVRTALWRTFDFMWGLHIMDWSTRENFNSWWIKMTASVAVIFFITGVALVSLRVSTAIQRRNTHKKGPVHE